VRACARECAARERVFTARKHSHAHAPPPRRRKAQRRDVSHCFRKSRLVTAAWRCTRPLTPRAGAPAVKAVAVVVRMASIVRGTERDERDWAPGDGTRGHCTSSQKSSVHPSSVNSSLSGASSWGTGHEDPRARGPRLRCSPGWASTRAPRWTASARRRACAPDKAHMARQPRPPGPVARGWPHLPPRCRPGQPMALLKPARRDAGRSWAGWRALATVSAQRRAGGCSNSLGWVSTR